MKRIIKFLSLFVAVFGLFFLASCDNNSDNTNNNGNNQTELVDYVSKVKLEKSFIGKTFIDDGIEEVTLYQSVDGDTIHVYNGTGAILKLRFLGVDTPESTAQVEAWGAAASAYTKNIVKNCKSLVITTDEGPGSMSKDTYDRYLAWVWYKMDDASEYKLLNLELVQIGYSKGKNSGVKNYTQELIDAADQARKQGIKVWGETDPNYCYTEAKEITLKELVSDLNKYASESQYFQKKVVFTAQVVCIAGATYYLNYTDPETNIVYGIQAFHRSGQTGYMDKLGVTLKLSGTVTYYEAGDVYQITDIIDRLMSSNKNNIQIVEDPVTPVPTEITADKIDKTNQNLKFNYISIKNLKVKSIYTTQTEGSSSKGAMTLTCEVDGNTVSIRTEVLYDKTGKYVVDSLTGIVLAETFENKTIDVVGVLEQYQGNYQIKLVSMDDVVFH